MNPVLIATLLAIVLLIFHLFFTYAKVIRKIAKLCPDQSRSEQPFLIRVLMIYHMCRAMAGSGLILEMIYLVLSQWVIQHQQQYIYHSVLSRGEHCAYYDFHFAILFYQTNLLAILVQLALLFSLRGKITRVLTNKLLICSAIAITKLVLDVHRINNNHSTTLYQTVQFLLDLVMIILLVWLFLCSASLKSLSIHLEMVQEQKRKEVYQEQMSKLQDQPNKDILAYSAKVNKALDTYHQLKNIRKHSALHFWQGRNFSGMFIGVLCIIYFSVNFLQFRSLYTQSAPIFSPLQMKKLQDSQEQEGMHEQSSHQKQNVVLYILSGVEYESFSQYMQPILQQNGSSGVVRLYRVSALSKASSVGSWVSLLSGTTPEMHGVYGDSASLDMARIDSILRSIDQDEQMDHMIYGNDFFEDAIQQLYPNVRLSRYFKENTEQRNILREPSFKNRTKTQKIGRFIQLYEQNDADHSQQKHTAQQQLKQLKQQYSALQLKTSLSSDDDDEYARIVEDLQNMMGRQKVKSLINKNYFLIAQDDEFHSISGHPYKDIAHLKEKALQIGELLSSLKNQTTLIITSDCHMPHSVPLFIYRRSDVTLPASSSPPQYSLIDIAPTLAVLMKQPIPRLNQGRFLNDSLVLSSTDTLYHLQQLYFQQKRLVTKFMDKFRLYDNEFNEIQQQSYEQLRKEAIPYYQAMVDSLASILDHAIRHVQLNQLTHNIIISSLAMLIMNMLVVIMLQQVTSMDIVSLFAHRPSQSQSINQYGLYSALCIYSLMFIVCSVDTMGWYYVVKGHYSFDVHVVSTALDIGMFLMFSLVKPIAFNIILQNYLFYHHATWSCQQQSGPNSVFHAQLAAIDPSDDYTTASKYLTWSRLPFLSKNELEYQPYAMAKIYVTRMYMVLVGIVIGGAGVMLQSCSDLLIPQEVSQLRFVMIYLLFLNGCTLALSLYSLFLWPQFSLTKSCMDSLYLLHQYKTHKTHNMPVFIISFLNSAFVRHHTNVEQIKQQKAYSKEGQKGESNDEPYRKALLEQYFRNMKEEQVDVRLQDKANNFSDEQQVLDESLLNLIYRDQS